MIIQDVNKKMLPISAISEKYFFPGNGRPRKFDTQPSPSFGFSKQTATDFRFNVSDMISALVYARAVHPYSKSRTYAIENAKKLAGYNMIVTSEISMPASEIYAAYHNLWRIEESFRIMKSQLDARPVYLQKEETITGHFIICYLAVLLTRLLQIHVLKDKYGAEEIFDFIHDFKVAKVSDRKYINLARNSSFIKDLSVRTGLPLTSYFLGKSDINKMLSHRF